MKSKQFRCDRLTLAAAAWAALVLAFGAATALSDGGAGSQACPMAAAPRTAQRPWLGITFGPPPEAPSRILVKGFAPGSPAEAAGLAQGDLLLAYDGAPLADVQAFRLWLRGLAPGQDVTLRMQRGAAEVEVSFTVAVHPEDRESCGNARSPAAAFDAGIDWLLARQLPNGAWPVADASVLGETGAANPPRTVLALLALQGRRRDAKVAAAWDRGLEWLLRCRHPSGRVGDPDGGLELANYTTAFLLRLLVQEDPRRYAAEIAELVRYFEREQFQQANGFQPHDWPYGGWNYFDEIRRSLLRADMTLSGCVLHALALAQVKGDAPVMERARVFLASCQNLDRPTGANDGGFFFSPRGSKAGLASSAQGELVLDSYGTMTADGLRALLNSGLPAGDERVQAAYGWMARNFALDRVPGFPDQHLIDWRLGLRFYYYHSLALALGEYERAAGRPADGAMTDWRARLAGHLAGLQNSNGSWKNPVNVMGEDEPLIATLLALNTLRATGADGSRQ